MKCVLVHGRFSNSWESQAFGLIGAYLHEHRPDVELSFFHGTLDSDKEILEGCSGADVVAFSCTSPAFDFARRLAEQIKVLNPKVWITVGGYHPSALPRRSLSSGIDQVVVGEGEAAMLDILNGNRDPVVQGRPMEFEELPWSDRNLIRNERHIEVAFQDTGERITSFQSHRGCPFNCRFCADGKRKVLSGGRPVSIRHRDVDDLLDEIEKVSKEYRLDLFKFCDPTWNTRLDWVLDFCQKKIDRNLTVPFFANIHARTCSEELFKVMASSGCREIGLGVESGSARILASMGKGINKDHVRQAVKWAKQYGIHVRGYFIIGMPEEKGEDLLLTEAFAEELALDEYGFSFLCPYPGSDFYDPVTMQDIDWSVADEYSNDFWETNHLSNEELKGWQIRLGKKFSRKLTWHQQLIEQRRK